LPAFSAGPGLSQAASPETIIIDANTALNLLSNVMVFLSYKKIKFCRLKEE
jgi:hypothetical protein